MQQEQTKDIEKKHRLHVEKKRGKSLFFSGLKALIKERLLKRKSGRAKEKIHRYMALQQKFQKEGYESLRENLKEEGGYEITC